MLEDPEYVAETPHRKVDSPLDVFIYFPPGMLTPRDEIEDALQECMGERGEVTGGVAGVEGSNLDLLILEDDETLMDEIRLTLRKLEISPDTVMVIDGEEYSFGSD